MDNQRNENVVNFVQFFREKLAQAYDFALEKIGMDLHAFSIWNDYVQFLRSAEATGSYAENQKITAVRKVYQKAVVTPIIGIEILWKEYIQFEHNINPIISEKMSLERSRDYMNARRVAKELEFVTKGLNRNLPAIPPTLTKEEMKQVNFIHFDSEQEKTTFLNIIHLLPFQVELWKKYIAFEKSNPLRSEDTALVTRRVMFATEQCLLVLTHHPAVWHQAAQFLDQSSKVLAEKGVSRHQNPSLKASITENDFSRMRAHQKFLLMKPLTFWIVQSAVS